MSSKDNSQKTDLNHPDTTITRRENISKKPFMHRMYVEWYQLLQDSLPSGAERIIELGSGPGFISEQMPGVITSDILYLPYLDVIMNGRHLPFGRDTIDSILMVDVFHHISEAETFFHEVERVLLVGGRLIMIEPWVTPWSKWVLNRFHHEPVDVDTVEWSFIPSGPLTGANQALPWIVFERDQALFLEKFPGLNVITLEPFMPLTYILGGGFSLHASLPGCMYPLIRKVEQRWIDPQKAGMFVLIVVEKIK